MKKNKDKKLFQKPFNKADNGGNIGGSRVCAAHCTNGKKIQLILIHIKKEKKY
jgi:cytosine/adenosine deaminase-related metal-dependent hydrolase